MLPEEDLRPHQASEQEHLRKYLTRSFLKMNFIPTSEREEVTFYHGTIIQTGITCKKILL